MTTPNIATKKSNFISRAAAAAQLLKTARETLLALESEYVNIGYNAGGAYQLADADFIDSNAYMDTAMIVALMTTQGNLETFWGAGNGTNIDNCTP